MAAVVTALALALVVVVLVNASKDRRQAQEARVGELRAVAERELVHDPVAAAIALLEAFELSPATTRRPSSPARCSTPQRATWSAWATRCSRWGLGGQPAGGHRAVRQRNPDLGRAYGPRLTDAAERGRRRHPEQPPRRGPDQVGFLNMYDLQGKDPPGLGGDFGRASDASFSPDGSLLVTSNGPVATLWTPAIPPT